MVKPEELKAWRQGTRTPYEWIARVCGVGRETVRNWERGLISIPDDSAEVVEALMSGGYLKGLGRQAPDLSTATELELIEELALRARQREYRGTV